MGKIMTITVAFVLLLFATSSCGRAEDIEETQIPAHEGSPIITMDVSRVMQGSFDHFYIYEDGYVIATSEINMRMPFGSNQPTRIWKTGQVANDEMAALIELFRNGGFMELNESYSFPGTFQGGGSVFSDVGYTISIVYGDLNKKVGAWAYLRPADMPVPMYEISSKLFGITLLEVTREKIQ